MSNMTLSEELKWRGLIKDKTFTDEGWLDKPEAFYLGIDVGSSDSLTVGNLAIVILARNLANAGWRAVMVMGGGTSLVGDPGGKLEERELISRETVKSNSKGVRAQVTQLFKGENYTILDNFDWLSDLRYVDFLREVGKHFSMTELMQRDFVTERMGEGGSGISYAEFSYSLIQGYDFWHLFNKHDVTMQIGGSDQWGNLLSGVSLIRKKEGKDAHALTIPLIINKATGQKFGKSEDGAIWLDADKTSVYKFYQFWLNIDDESVGDYLKIFTELNKDEVTRVMAEFHGNKGARLAQKTLAYEVTKLVHGAKRADTVKRITNTLFDEGNFDDLSRGEVAILKSELPVVKVTRENGLATIVTSAGLASSNSEALRFIASGAITVNGNKVNASEEYPFHKASNLLKRGKNNFAIVEHK